MGACVDGPADGPSAQVEVWIAAPAERVWALVSDITTPAKFSTELLEVRWLDEGPRVGARFVGRSRHRAMGEWETTAGRDWLEQLERLLEVVGQVNAEKGPDVTTEPDEAPTRRPRPGPS